MQKENIEIYGCVQGSHIENFKKENSNENSQLKALLVKLEECQENIKFSIDILIYRLYLFLDEIYFRKKLIICLKIWMKLMILFQCSKEIIMRMRNK